MTTKMLKTLKSSKNKFFSNKLYSTPAKTPEESQQEASTPTMAPKASSTPIVSQKSFLKFHKWLKT